MFFPLCINGFILCSTNSQNHKYYIKTANNEGRLYCVVIYCILFHRSIFKTGWIISTSNCARKIRLRTFIASLTWLVRKLKDMSKAFSYVSWFSLIFHNTQACVRTCFRRWVFWKFLKILIEICNWRNP